MKPRPTPRYTVTHEVVGPDDGQKEILVQLRLFLPSEGGPPLPSTNRFVAGVQFPEEDSPQRQMVCEFLNPVDPKSGLVKARVGFHGYSKPDWAALKRTPFKLFAGERQVGFGAAISSS